MGLEPIPDAAVPVRRSPDRDFGWGGRRLPIGCAPFPIQECRVVDLLGAFPEREVLRQAPAYAAATASLTKSAYLRSGRPSIACSRSTAPGAPCMPNSWIPAIIRRMS
jgi:hypothetical protein